MKNIKKNNKMKNKNGKKIQNKETKNKINYKLLSILFLLIILISLLIIYTLKQTENNLNSKKLLNQNEGKLLDIKLLNLNNKIENLSQYKQKKIIILQAMASWCNSCIYQALELKKIKKKYPNIKILSIDLDSKKDSIKSVKNFKENIGANWDFSIDYKQDFILKYKIKSLDETIIIDKNNNEVFRSEKITSSSDLDSILKKIN